MTQAVTVVDIRSLSYTGTTWLNLMLGSHDRAFALGPPDQAWSSRATGWDDRCRVHGTGCSFWPALHRAFDPKGNFYLQLAEFAGKDVIVINNPLPDQAGAELSHPRIRVREIRVVRDGRALAASYRRKFPEQATLECVRDWLAPSFNAFAFDRDDPDRLCIRYEDAVADQLSCLRACGAFIGLDYDRSALRFWDHEHHIASGNAGTIIMVKLAQGIHVPDNRYRPFYEQQLARLQADPDADFSDERWREELAPRERFVFDHFCGEQNARFGYERDRFTVAEVQEFGAELQAALTKGTSPPLDRSVRPRTFAPGQAPRIGMRRQLRLSALRRTGLHLEPRQVRRAAIAAAVALLVLLLVTVIVTLIVTMLFTR